MDIIIAKTAGYCMGVKRAVDLAVKSGGCSLGNLIHNPDAVKYLGAKGVVSVSSLDDVVSGNVIIRSHGASKQVYEDIKKKGLSVVDTTCPFVKRVHDITEGLVNEGYHVLLLGDKGHPEAEAVNQSFDEVTIVESLDDCKCLPYEKVGFVCQTTQSTELYKEVARFLGGSYSDVKINYTICNASEARQKEAKTIASRVDCMVVVGGYSSANTNRLADICKGITKTYHVERVSELDESDFKKLVSVGVTAGASTPDFIFDEVVDFLDRI